MISGLVAYFSQNEVANGDSLDQIGRHPAFEVGMRQAYRLPLVLETADPGESHDMLDWLHSLPGIDHVDVTFVHLEAADTNLVSEEVDQL